jgi:hypothetical protein
LKNKSIRNEANYLPCDHRYKPRHLSPEERAKLTAVFASYDGRQFGAIEVRTFPGCHECLVYVNDLVNAINSIPGWSAEGGANYHVKVDFSGIGIGVKDSKLLPRVAQITADALKAAELQFTIETLDAVFTLETLESISPDTFMLVIGSKR